MPHHGSARAATRPRRRAVLAVVAVVVAALVGVLGPPSWATSASPGASDTAVRSGATAARAADGPPRHRPPGRLGSRPGGHDGALGEADGAVPDGTTVFDDVPAVTNLEPGLRTALRRAATGAARDGVTVVVNSGWRSGRYQDQLLREAVSQYGSQAEAARWVATADTSLHVSGDAVDIGPPEASTWLSERGAGYGLCRVYRNEPWHYELRPQAVDHGCPAPYADPTQDPRTAR